VTGKKILERIFAALDADTIDKQKRILRGHHTTGHTKRVVGGIRGAIRDVQGCLDRSDRIGIKGVVFACP